MKGLTGAILGEVAWAPDGNGFYLTGESPRFLLLLRVEMDGEAHVLREYESGVLSSPVPSPDGRHLAFGKLTVDSNVWMVEGL